MKNFNQIIPPIVFVLVIATKLASADTHEISTAPPGPTTNAEVSLLKMALEKFTNSLSSGEKLMISAAAKGTIADYTTGAGCEDNPTNSANWTTNRAISSDHLAWLCTDPMA